MARWEPNARERLQQSALELFDKRGYAQTTVEDIAARAGLTERTFFRYFADKREVLFWGSEALQQCMVDAIASAPAEATPLEAVGAGLEATTSIIPSSRERAKARNKLIAAHAELRERELLKLTSLASAAGDALRARGVGEPGASLAAETGIAVFKIAFERWSADTKRADLRQHIRSLLVELKALAAETGRPSRTRASSTSRRS